MNEKKLWNSGLRHGSLAYKTGQTALRHLDGLWLSFVNIQPHDSGDFFLPDTILYFNHYNPLRHMQTHTPVMHSH